MRKVIAICCSDLHFTERPPVARSCEEDWFAVQRSYCKQLNQFKKKYLCPIIVAGDVFDRWNASPATIINVATSIAPFAAIVGQHDLPNHRSDQVTSTAFGVLILMNVIQNNMGPQPFHASFFPWGSKPFRHPKAGDGLLCLAVMHHYCWQAGHSHPGAKPEDEACVIAKELKALGYNAAVIGDNHRGFLYEEEDFSLLVPGTFIRRKQDERFYQPCVGLLWSDGTFTREPLDCSADKFVDVPEGLIERDETDYEAVLEELRSLGDKSEDFLSSLLRLSEGMQANQKRAQELIRKIVEECRSKQT